ncbi:MAG TPA: hypothetical protein VKX25_08040 [Bryobacteraceae bacterium]|jgi:hypothetical protein|nr:hypothetical protein [Bryobacteraceae bacterium]
MTVEKFGQRRNGRCIAGVGGLGLQQIFGAVQIAGGFALLNLKPKIGWYIGCPKRDRSPKESGKSAGERSRSVRLNASRKESHKVIPPTRFSTLALNFEAGRYLYTRKTNGKG